MSPLMAQNSGPSTSVAETLIDAEQVSISISLHVSASLSLSHCNNKSPKIETKRRATAIATSVSDKNEGGMKNEVIQSSCSKSNEKDVSHPISTPGKNDAQINMDSSGEVNMEAAIIPDDVIRAGGFGARDDISSFLPVASDSTDFEASIRDAQDYEEPQGQKSRPGLGWKGATKTE